jgi:hypothetical protein
MPLGIAIGNGIGLGGGKSIVYLFRDEFATADPAPISDPLPADPGPGEWAYVLDDNDYLSVAGGSLHVDTSTQLGSWSNPSVVGDTPLSRATGLALVTRITHTSGGAADNYVGFLTNPLAIGSYAGKHAMVSRTPTTMRFYCDDGPIEVSPGTLQRMALVLRSVGMFGMTEAGGVWRLHYPFADLADDNLYPVIAVAGHVTVVKDWHFVRVAQLPAPWNSDYGLATERLAGARSDGDTFSHNADCVFEIEVTTAPTTATAIVAFRQQDASNEWRLQINTSGDLKLVELVGGAPTTRGDAAGVVSDGSRVVVVMEDDAIIGYCDDAEVWSYSSAANFKTETAGALKTVGTGAAFSDLVVYPRFLSGAALATLDAI